MAPSCGSNVCGADGCGGTCGVCASGTACQAGQCVGGTCAPSCGSNVCGDDGCGGSCGICTGGQTCQGGQCVGSTCTPNCGSNMCGDDGCGGSCGTCSGGESCSNGQCVSSGGSCSHDICSSGKKLKANCDPCVAQICDADPYCCKKKWNYRCVNEVDSICAQSCN